MRKLDTKELRDMFMFVCESIISKETYLCELDSFVGDGDHGVTVARGFGRVLELLRNTEFDTSGTLMKRMGFTLTEAMGGAIGPVFGSIFLAAGQTVGAKPEIDVLDLYRMFDASLGKVKALGRAEEGDRTVIDALAPAVRALKQAAQQGLPIEQALKLAADGARQGAADTKGMVAKRGRAAFMGEKSLGHQDAGATSISIIFEAMHRFADALGTGTVQPG